jgi:ADP-heptose:LPS heptosyltransferase
MAASLLVKAERIFILHAGGLGDLVLSAPALGAIRAALPNRHITFCCRREFVGLLACWPFAFDRIIEIGFRPYVMLPTDAEPHRGIDEFFRAVHHDVPDAVMSMELAPTWLTPAVVSYAKPAISLARSYDVLPPAVLETVLDRLSLKSFPVTTYDWSPDRPERERYDKILQQLNIPEQALAPWSPPSSAQDAADTFLTEKLEADASPLACFFLGNPKVLTKRWPLERFIDVTAKIAETRGLVPILFGDRSEARDLAAIAEQLQLGGMRAVAYAGDPESLPTVVALLARCSAFLGNDTGLAHLCAALGVPGTTMYGGGTWPSYEPWAPGTVGVVSPLPCFGCGWDCAFEKALCLDGLDPQDALTGFDQALERAAEPRVLAIERRSPTEWETIGMASATFRAAQLDRNKRYDVIVGLENRLHQAERLIELQREMLLAAEAEKAEERTKHEAEIRRLGERS